MLFDGKQVEVKEQPMTTTKPLLLFLLKRGRMRYTKSLRLTLILLSMSVVLLTIWRLLTQTICLKSKGF